jgi:hypothetical protein
LPTRFVASDRSPLIDGAQRIREKRFRLVRRRQCCRNRPGCRPGELKPTGQSRQGRFQRGRIDLIGHHHGQDHRIGQKIGQRQLAVIHRGATRVRVEIG